MKAIWTKYIPCTNFRGSRIKAEAEGVSVTVPSASELNAERAHDEAALALVRKMGWPGTLVRGGRPDMRGYVYVIDVPCERIETGVPSYAEQARRRQAIIEAGGLR